MGEVNKENQIKEIETSKNLGSLGNETEITIQSYNKTAQQYAQNVANLQKTTYIEHFVSLLPANALVLDMACGSGRDARIFSEKGLSVTGIDLSQEMLKIAAQTCSEAKFRLMDIRQLNFDSQYFNGVWACAALLHIPKEEIPSLISGVLRVLKKGGIFYIGVKEGDGERFVNDARYGGNIMKFYSYFKSGELEAILNEKGFDMIHSSGVTRKENYLKCPEIDILCRRN
jgi:ubiquinone/menaquinone biosynthesis C-methylase UbiE